MNPEDRESLKKIDTQTFWVGIFTLIIMFGVACFLIFHDEGDWFLGILTLLLSGQTLRNFLYWNKHTRIK